MSPGQLFALVERLHGHLAVLGLAVLLHPVITLRTRPGLALWTRRTADLGALLLLVPFAMGWWIYPAYRSEPKLRLYALGDPAWLWFESKEHLAAFAVGLAVAGALTLHVDGRTARGRRAAWAMLLAGWVCGALTAVLGIVVAARAAPAW